MTSVDIYITRKSDDFIIVQITSDDNALWKKEYSRETKIQKLYEDYEQETNMDFPNEIKNILKSQRDRKVTIEEETLMNYVNNYEEDNESFNKAYNIEIPEIIGKPFSNPFALFTYIKKEKAIKLLKFGNNNILNELNDFSSSSAYCNGNNKLFISGGENSQGEYVKKFWIIDLKTSEIESNYMIPKKNHSMISIPRKFVFIVGGQTKQTFYFDTENSKFHGWKALNKKRIEPALILVDNYLYCFDNMNSSNLNEKLTFEKTNLNSIEHNWELFEPIMPSIKMNQKYFGVVKNNNDIIFIGGNLDTKDEMERKSFKYNLNNNKIEESEINYINYNFKEKSFLKYNEKINYILPDFNRYHPEVMFYQKEKKDIKILKCYSKKKLEEKEREKQEKNNKDFTPIKFSLKHNLNQPKELNSNNNTNLVEDSNKDKDVKIINENLENENNNNDNDFKNEQYQIKINRTNSFEEQEKERENEYEQNEQNDGIEQVQQKENEEQNIEQSEEKREKQSDEYNEEQNEEQIDEEKEEEDDELNYSINLFFFYIQFPFSLINLFTKEEEFQSHITLDKISIIHGEDQIEEYNKIQNVEEYPEQNEEQNEQQNEEQKYEQNEEYNIEQKYEQNEEYNIEQNDEQNEEYKIEQNVSFYHYLKNDKKEDFIFCIQLLLIILFPIPASIIQDEIENIREKHKNHLIISDNILINSFGHYTEEYIEEGNHSKNHDVNLRGQNKNNYPEMQMTDNFKLMGNSVNLVNSENVTIINPTNALKDRMSPQSNIDIKQSSDLQESKPNINISQTKVINPNPLEDDTLYDFCLTGIIVGTKDNKDKYANLNINMVQENEIGEFCLMGIIIGKNETNPEILRANANRNIGNNTNNNLNLDLNTKNNLNGLRADINVSKGGLNLDRNRNNLQSPNINSKVPNMNNISHINDLNRPNINLNDIGINMNNNDNGFFEMCGIIKGTNDININSRNVKLTSERTNLKNLNINGNNMSSNLNCYQNMELKGDPNNPNINKIKITEEKFRGNSNDNVNEKLSRDLNQNFDLRQINYFNSNNNNNRIGKGNFAPFTDE